MKRHLFIPYDHHLDAPGVRFEHFWAEKDIPFVKKVDEALGPKGVEGVSVVQVTMNFGGFFVVESLEKGEVNACGGAAIVRVLRRRFLQYQDPTLVEVGITYDIPVNRFEREDPV